jgi:hypothetical protein
MGSSTTASSEKTRVSCYQIKARATTLLVTRALYCAARADAHLRLGSAETVLPDVG